MKSISIDIETYSSTNLQKSGVYRYAESDDFEILLFGYSVDGSDVKVIDLCMGDLIFQPAISDILLSMPHILAHRIDTPAYILAAFEPFDY